MKVAMSLDELGQRIHEASVVVYITGTEAEEIRKAKNEITRLRSVLKAMRKNSQEATDGAA